MKFQKDWIPEFSGKYNLLGTIIFGVYVIALNVEHLRIEKMF